MVFGFKKWKIHFGKDVSDDNYVTSMPLSGLSNTSLQWCFEVMQTAWCKAMDACTEIHGVPESIDGKT